MNIFENFNILFSIIDNISRLQKYKDKKNLEKTINCLT